MMHRKYDTQLAEFESKAVKKDEDTLRGILISRDKRRENHEIIKSVMQLDDVLKAAGLWKYKADFESTSARLWLSVKSKKDLEAASRIAQTFGFQAAGASDCGDNTVILKLKSDGFTLELYCFFAEDAQCKMVQVGTKEVPVFERQCTNGETEVLDASTLNQPPTADANEDGDIPF